MDFLWQIENPFWFPPEATSDQLAKIRQKLDSIEQQLGAARCKASERSDAGALAYLVTGVDGNDGREDLKSWLRDCELLEIADPYFFSLGAYKKNPEVLIERFQEILPDGMQRIVIFHRPKPAKSLFEGFSEVMRKRNVRTQFFRTEGLHDRVWIKNGNSAKVVGTSFNGLGNKLAFILDLPSADRLAFQEQLTAVRKRQKLC